MGHIVSESVIETDPAKEEHVCDWPVPENAYDVEVRFLGLSSYYRRFTLSFAKWPDRVTN